MISSGAGGYPNTATGNATTTTPTGQSSDQDVSTPLAIDYLKVRCYLYKFTPNMFFGGSAPPPPIQSNLSTQVQQTVASCQTMLATIQKLRTLSGSAPISAFTGGNGSYTPPYSTFGNALIAFLNLSGMPTSLNVTSSVVIQFDNAEGNPEFTGLYANSIALYNFLLSGGTATGFTVSPMTAQQDLSDWLGYAAGQLTKAMITASEAQTQAATQATYVAATLKQFEVNRFVYDLNVADLSRFDLSRYISQYTVDQVLGNITTPGSISGTAVLQDMIIAFQDLGPIPGPTAVRRNIFFPNATGDYYGYANGIPTTTASSLSGNDPITGESVSTLQAKDLVTRIAMLQTLEDNGGTDTYQGYPDAYTADVDRIEMAIRLRGIKDANKKKLILEYFNTGLVTDELVRLVTPNTLQPSFNPFGQIATQVATAALQQPVTPLGLSSPSLTSAQQAVKNSLTSLPGFIHSQLQDLRNILTDNKLDGIAVSDLIQKYDFFSIFVYKHNVSPDWTESQIELATGDANFFDKESLFLATPVFYLQSASLSDNRTFATYNSEVNGFVAETSYTSTPGSVNTITLNIMGSMGLMGATKRIYNSTIFQASVFDAAETMDSSSTISLFQNLYANKNPLQILTILLDSLYLLRVGIPQSPELIGLTADQRDAITTQLQAQAAAVGGTVTPAQITNAQNAAQQNLQTTTLGGNINRDTGGNMSAFFDILSLRAFNQYGMTETDGVSSTSVQKGPIHLFNMASYLYANVMRMRRFNVRLPTKAQVNDLGPQYTINAGATGTKPPYLKESPLTNPTLASGVTYSKGAFNPFGGTNAPTKLIKDCDGSGGSVLEINPFLDVQNLVVPTAAAQAWKVYFLFLNASLGNFVADLKTPFEIMGDVVSSCYLELFETAGGRFIFRTPQYNNNIPLYRLQSQDNQVQAPTGLAPTISVTNNSSTLVTTTNQAASAAQMLTSDDINVISTEYKQTVKNLVSKQSAAYGADLLGAPIIPQLYYFYSNGKMVAQYGLNMGRAVENPNVRAIPRDKLINTGLSVNDSTIMNGIFHYCRFFLEYSNMNNFSATITAVADPSIQVGLTYFDVKNQKFGYITHVSKSMTVGDVYTCTFNLNAVRDAIYGPVISNSGAPTSAQPLASPIFRRLPEMEDFIGKFSAGASLIPNIANGQTQSPTPSKYYIIPHAGVPYLVPLPLGGIAPAGPITNSPNGGLPPGTIQGGG